MREISSVWLFDLRIVFVVVWNDFIIRNKTTHCLKQDVFACILCNFFLHKYWSDMTLQCVPCLHIKLYLYGMVYIVTRKAYFILYAYILNIITVTGLPSDLVVSHRNKRSFSFYVKRPSHWGVLWVMVCNILYVIVNVPVRYIGANLYIVSEWKQHVCLYSYVHYTFVVTILEYQYVYVLLWLNLFVFTFIFSLKQTGIPQIESE